ncbi:2-hydroxyacid dehydrogenase [Flavobacterium jejuense]|uniref:2-hydroxyacid dehydrogenase n=1 Tax=Flavobacterium jejuense TaxID=1544455 RepID=A0ABX0IM30_9FLAO|nr:NAD(P)-dependent oxidoreductase [Flavobacterium jejuense]NHN24773.1 2-hydroxyacid dehydrogenase [Flavobacterium jejuense]
MKTLVYSTHDFDKSFLKKAAKNKHKLTFSELPLNDTSAKLANGFEAVALFTADKANKETLELLHKNGIRYIALRSVGYDHVDLKKAKQLELKVANVPNYSPYASAEHAVTLLLSLNRKILLSQELMYKNDFRLDELVGFDLHGKTIGIIGTGTIGTVFTKIMHGFGCKLMGYDILENKALINQTNIKYTSFEELCQSSDVISIHCPLNDATNYLLDKKAFQLMKKGVIIINTARGGIINTLDLMEALDNGIVAAAGLDVYENEKGIYFKDLSSSNIHDELFEKLRSYANVLLTGHQAFLTKEALQGIAETTISNLSEWTENGISKNDLY